MCFTRRRFCVAGAAVTFSNRYAPPQTSRVDVASLEHAAILAEAAYALRQSPRPLADSSPPKPGSKANAFFSEPESVIGTTVYRTHADALITACANIAALTAAYVLTKEDRYALHAGKHLFAWFVDPGTRMDPSMPSLASPASVADLAPLAEVARAVPFLVDTEALSPPYLAKARAWFADVLHWLNNDRIALIAREAKDHNGSSWLLLTTSFARLLGDESTLNACRLRFKKPTLRSQIGADGDFPREIASPFPLRNTLLNFDLLACACELMSTPFSTLWTYELEDGPGLRGVSAFLFPLVRDPARWPYLADVTKFREVPLRRPALLLAGRAYDRPEYVDLWRTLPQPPRNMPMPSSFPIRQPLLWTTRAPHGA